MEKIKTLDEASKQEMINKLGSLLHEEWRAPRKKEDGTFDPRIKKTKDLDWSKENGAEEVDIANTDYNNLPEDWKGENKISAEVAVTEVEKAIDAGIPLDESFIEDASSTLHDKWLERNGSWAPAEQNKPYTELSEEEKEKDRVIIRKAIEVCGIKNETVEAVQSFEGLSERMQTELKNKLGYTLNIVEKADGFEVEVSRSRVGEYDTNPEFSSKGILPKTEKGELSAIIKRLTHNIDNFGEAYGMPEIETRETLNKFADKLKK